MRIVEEISARAPCINEQVMKNQYPGLTCALKDAATTALGGRKVSYKVVIDERPVTYASKMLAKFRNVSHTGKVAFRSKR